MIQNTNDVEMGFSETYNKMELENQMENPMEIQVERMSTNRIFDNIREELRQIYDSSPESEARQVNKSIQQENEELKYNEDTPYTMSLGNSRRNTLEENCFDNYDEHGHESFKKYSFEVIEESLVKYYKPAITKLDILIIYLNGQKNVYLQSHRITQLKLNMLYFPSLMLTSFTTFFAPFSYVDNIWWNNIALSVVNGMILILIAVASYSKFESAAANMFQLYSEYEKMIVNMEFFYNRTMQEQKKGGKKEGKEEGEGEESKNQMIQQKNDEIESIIQNLKTYFNVVVPKEIQNLFPILTHVNIFAFIKKIEEERNLLIQEYYNLKNEVRYILYRQKKTSHPLEINRQNKRINFLLKKKEQIKNDLVEYKGAFAKMEEVVMQEIKYAENKTTYFYFVSSSLFYTWQKPPVFQTNNKIMDAYLSIMCK